MADSVPVAVVLSAIPVEFEALYGHLDDVREQTHPAGTIFTLGTLRNTPWRVVLAETGPGNKRAAAITERAISKYHPELVIFAGVAGRLHTDLDIGDVVVATKVYAIHGGKEDDSGFRPRPETWFPQDGHIARAKRIERERTWQDALPDRLRSTAQVVFRPIAAGEVVLDSVESPLARMIRQQYGDAAAIEMEGAGFGLASHLNQSLPMVVVRGISDFANGEKEAADQGGGQQRAARNAAAFAMTLLADLPPTYRVTSEPTPPKHVLVSGVAGGTRPSSGRPRWSAGEQVTIGDREYLLVDDYLAERQSSSGMAWHREARALQIRPAPKQGREYLWLRQIEARPNMAPANADVAALAVERDLLTGLRSTGGFPRLVQYVHNEHVATLVTGWPAAKAGGLPCETLDVLSSPGSPLDEWRTAKLLKGFAGLCQTLAVLHKRGRSHRHLTPSGLIRLDNDTVQLRDLGLAGWPHRPGEGASTYAAPEQRRRTLAQPGPQTDVFQLAALTYHVFTGQLPDPVRPLPLRHYRADLDGQLGQAIDAALNADPSARPGLSVLGSAFRLPRERSCTL